MNKWLLLALLIGFNQTFLWVAFSSIALNVFNIFGWLVALKLTIWKKQ